MGYHHPPYHGPETDHADSRDSSLTRRSVIKHGAAAVVAGGAAALFGDSTTVAAQAGTTARPSPGATAGTRFRAMVRYGNNLAVQQLTLRPIHPQQVVVRTQATQACYTIVSALNTSSPPRNAHIVGHGGVGIVEEIGSQVKRVQVGDRVLVAVTPQCGSCGQCLAGRADVCVSFAVRPQVPAADMADGTPVLMDGAIGGFGELMVSWEEYLIPVFTTLSAAELSLLSCVATTGLGLAMMRIPVEPGSDVAVFGAGPVGLSAIQGARIMGAAQIIAVEPVRYRRDLALKLGATVALDPNVDKGDALVTKIKDLAKGSVPTERMFAGARGFLAASRGPRFVIEAVGGARFPPKVEAGPDPTGVEALQQAWAVAPSAGYVRTSGVGHPPNATVTFPAGAWSNGSKTHAPGNFASVNTMRDIPRFVRLIESKLFDAKSLVGSTFPLDRAREALQAAADRTVISAIVVFEA